MNTASKSTSATKGGTWISEWRPEDATFWESTGKAIAWRTLVFTTFSLMLSFASWFFVSAIVVKLQGIGFQLTKEQLFWLTAMPGLAGGTLRIIHTFLIPMFGTRTTISVATLLLVIPCIGWGIAVQNPNTPFSVLMLLAFLAGLGGGNFSSFMPSTSLFFPKRLQGTALGIQAGVGNFGVSVAQFVVPWIIGFALFGSLLGGSQTFTTDGHTSALWLQNAAFIWVPFILLAAILSMIYLRSVPVRAKFREQTDIFKSKHTWFMTSLYIMTFGSFSGFAAIFPLLIKEIYTSKFEGGPDPLKYAFLGPLVGALVRVLFGPISDKLGGAKVTTFSAIGLIICAIGVTFYTNPTSVDQFSGFVWFMLGLFFFSGAGNASTFKQMPMIFEPRQAAGVIGWTSAIAAYGPFIFSVAVSRCFQTFGTASVFFYSAAIFYLFNLVLNWWFYGRSGAEKPC